MATSNDSVFFDEEFRKHSYDEDTYGFSFSPALDSGETISTVDAITIELVNPTDGTSSLTAADEAVNAATFTLRDGTTVAIGKGVQATIAGGTEGQKYHVHVKVTTSTGAKKGGTAIFHVDA